MLHSTSTQAAEGQYMDRPTSFHYNFILWFLLASVLVLLYLRLAHLYPSLVFFQVLHGHSLLWTYIAHLSLVLPQNLFGLRAGLLDKLSNSWFPPRITGDILCTDHDNLSTSLFLSLFPFFILIA